MKQKLFFSLFAIAGSACALRAAPSCAKCHAAIVRSYAQTPMARTSGPTEALPPGEFTANGYRYSIEGRRLSFGKGAVETRELPWYVGSGASARSYLIAVDNFLYEAPATWYAQSKAWGLSPGYARYPEPFLTRAIAPACLECHATGVQAIPRTQNGYRDPPFRDPGIGCERCHGPGEKHAASADPRDILNPASLAPARRDSVCAQCHLSGEIRVDRAGKSMSDFRPGELLADYAVAFVRQTSQPGMKVTSHMENLAQSACSRNSAGRLWCGTCHDPHTVPAPAERVAWYRAKCRTCHEAAVCARGENCIGCHMPPSAVTDAEHVVFTDHSIPRRPVPRDRKPPSGAPLAAFGGAAASTRDLGLAYAIVALRTPSPADTERAFDLLRRNPDDPQSLAYLADIYRSRKDDRTAAQLYRKLYRLDSTLSSAPANLGAYAMDRGDNAEAIRLFEEALRISPALTLVRYNLALALIRTGRSPEAVPVLEKALRFNPAFTAARELLNRYR